MIYDILKFTLTVSATLAFAVRTASNTSVKTLTIFLLTVAFLAVASFAVGMTPHRSLSFCRLSRLFDLGLVGVVVVAAVAGALRCA